MSSIATNGATDGVRDAKPWEKSLGRFLEEIVDARPDKVFVEVGGGNTPTENFTKGC